MAQGERRVKSKETRKSPYTKKSLGTTKPGVKFIAQKKQVKGKSRQQAVKLEKKKTCVINNNIEEVIAAKVVLDGGKLAIKDLKQKGRDKLKIAKQILQKKQSNMKSKGEAQADSIIKKMDKEDEKNSKEAAGI